MVTGNYAVTSKWARCPCDLAFTETYYCLTHDPPGANRLKCKSYERSVAGYSLTGIEIENPGRNADILITQTYFSARSTA